MKTLLMTIAILFSVNAMAFTVEMPHMSFPNKSEWAKGKVKNACDIVVQASDYGVTTMTKVGGKKVYVYTVYTAQGDMVAQAASYSDLVWSKATCQN